MSYVEIWSTDKNRYDVNIITEQKRNVVVDNIANTKDRSIACFIAKEVARRNKLKIEFRIDN